MKKAAKPRPWLTAAFAAAILAYPAAWAAASPRNTGYRGIWFTLGQKTRIRRQILRRAGHLHGQPRAHGHLREGGRQDVLRLRRRQAGQAPPAGHGLLLRSRARAWCRGRPSSTTSRASNDPHDNPSLCIDPQGLYWVFVERPGASAAGLHLPQHASPTASTQFELICEREITYPQPRWIEGQGFLHLFTKYTQRPRTLLEHQPRRQDLDAGPEVRRHRAGITRPATSAATACSPPSTCTPAATSTSEPISTSSRPTTWAALGETSAGERSKCRLVEPDEPRPGARLPGREAAGLHPRPGPRSPRPAGDPLHHRPPVSSPARKAIRAGGPLRIGRATAGSIAEVTRANHNYSTGSLYIEDGQWRIIGPTERGPQPIGAGGEVAIWASTDEGKTWAKERDVTRDSPMNHNYVRRPVNAHPDFYAFWADGNPDKFSPSRLYFTNRAGDKVWQLPYDMQSDFARPEKAE